MTEHLYILPILLFSIIVHEVAHGWVALKLGDPTARDLGRLTLNPIPHIDLFGSIIVPLIAVMSPGGFFIAWAKPVPVNHANFANVRRDDILVSVAGPASNILMAFVCTVMFILTMQIVPYISEVESAYTAPGAAFLLKMFSGGITVNIVLAVFNMIPVPPLDGSHVLASLLPAQWSGMYRRIGFLGLIVIILLMSYEPFAVLFGSVIDVFQFPFEQLIQQFL